MLSEPIYNPGKARLYLCVHYVYDINMYNTYRNIYKLKNFINISYLQSAVLI